MNYSMINATSSMNALMRKLEIISNNISNMGTDGFKRQEASFEDLLTATIRQPHEQHALPGRLSPGESGLVTGHGARLSQVQINMAQGSLRPTDNPYDLAIEGDALFEIGIPGVDAGGDAVLNPAWTRHGAFQLSMIPGNDEQGMLVTADGNPVIGFDDQPVLLPLGRTISIDADGRIFATQAGDPAAPPTEVGQLKLVRAVRPQVLLTQGDNLFVLPPQLAAQMNALIERVDPALDGMNAAVRQGHLEGSNVDLAVELTELIQMQRAYQLSARALSSADSMMDITNRLRS
jgi:flagellar basal-body rod protein FlgG